MKDLFDTIHEHKSVRKYLEKDISHETIEKILSAGLRASSSGNMQSYSVIVTKDLELRKKLYEPHFQQSMVLEAPALLTFCADFHRMRLWLEQSKAPMNFDNFMSFMIGAIDAILASQNVALAAEAEGLGICYMGTTLASCDRIAEILELPENVVPVVGFSIGYPDESASNPRRDRLPLKGLVHQEKYQDYSRDDIQSIYHERESSGWSRYMQDPELKKRVKEFGAENLAQIYTKVKYTLESHKKYSNDVLKFLKKQNFYNND